MPGSVTGLSPDTTYHYRLDASNANGTNTGQGPEGPEDLGEFTTPGPGIHSESVSNVKATSATFEASIDPHAAPTSYYFQYGPSTGYGEYAPLLTASEPHGAAVGSGEGDVEVIPQHVQGLSAGTTYHYRAVAVSELAGEPVEFDGPDQTFTTQTDSGFVLPDGRAWEMVSPPDKHGANLMSFTEGEYVFQAAAAGNAMTYVATAPTEAQPEGFSNVIQVLSTRGPGSWGSRDIAVAHNADTGASTHSEYPFFSSDLSLGVVYPFGAFDPAVSTEASESTAYLRSDYPSGNVNALCLHSCYRPLVTGKAGFEDVPPGTVFGSSCPSRCGPEPLGATPDSSHVVLKSGVALTTTPVAQGLYEWAAGKLQLVSMLPASEGGGAVAGSLGNFEEKAARTGTISSDGSRVIWAPSGVKALYMSDTATGVTNTVRLDTVQSGGGEGQSEAVFQAASSDGSKVYFSDTQRLTEDAGAKTDEPDLYKCEIVEVKRGEVECRLSDLTPPSAGAGADVQAGSPGPPSSGAIVGASEDGSFLYFVADGVLAAGAERGQPNLYVRHDSATRLVAVLSGADHPDWSGGDGTIKAISARVSPSGEWLAFMSQRSLTGYDNRDAASGKPDEEVYLYDASSGRLVCASCDPTGARPLGEVFGTESSEQEEAFIGGNSSWGGEASVAAMVPGWTRALYQSRYLSDSGRLFFDSYDALVPQDGNGTWDVYEYDSLGVPASEHACTTSSTMFSERGGGCVGLISSGTSAEPSAFLDASATGGRDAEGREGGGDVFFLTAEKLARQDFDTSLDVYDAHECTGFAPCSAPAAPPAPCTTEASCKASPTPQPQIFGPGGSSTFSGAGNLAPPAPPKGKRAAQIRAEKLTKALKLCKKDKSKKKRAACQRRAKKRYGAAAAKRASNNRRAK